MSNRVRLRLFVLLLSVLSGGAYADECDEPKSSEKIAQCLGKDLRESDGKINSSYNEVMGKLNEGEKANFRRAQRTWIKDRDAVCQLDSKESNRERWYQALLKDYVRTVCVTRYTRQRTTELQSLLARLSSPHIGLSPKAGSAAPASPEASTNPGVAYDDKPVTVHASGKWYFELTINYGEAIRIEPCVVTVGVWDRQKFSGILDNIRPRDGNKDALRYGFAVDLDNGKLYVSHNGAWVHGEPGSNLGQDLQLGRDYYATYVTSADSRCSIFGTESNCSEPWR